MGSAGTKGETVAGSSKCESGADLSLLNMPTGVCIDPSDNSFLVTDRMNGRLLRFRNGSKTAEVVFGPDELERPWGVCMNSDGRIYVSDERRAVVLCLQSQPGAPSASPTKAKEFSFQPAPRGKVAEA